MRLSRGRLIVAGLAALFLVGFVFLRGPTPHITIKAETLQSVGPIDITNTMMTSWIVVIMMVAIVYVGTRRRDLVPRGSPANKPRTVNRRPVSSQPSSCTPPPQPSPIAHFITTAHYNPTPTLQ